MIPGLKEYVEYFLDDQMVGPDGPLADCLQTVNPSSRADVPFLK